MVVSGELDDVRAPELRAALHHAGESPSRRVVVDLGDLRFVDSIGISVLLQASANLSRQGGELVLRRPTEPVVRALRFAGLEGLLQVE